MNAAVVFSGGPSAAEQGYAPNESEQATTCSSNAPINCASGDFWHTFTDASIPGLGPALAFTRTYSSSAASTNGPLGYGWTDSYNMSLSFDTSGNATVTQEDGSTVPFRLNSGSYVSPPWVLASLVATSGGTYTFTRDSTNVAYVFNSSGQLISETDRNGYATSLSYSAGNLTTVTDQAGRTLTLAYSGSHLASVTDPLGNTTSYSYDPSGNLVGSTDALGRSWTFAYDPNHLLTSMTDPRGGTTANVFDASARVTQQTDPAGRVTAWSYSGDPSTPSGSTTAITDPRGVVSQYQYSNYELTSVTHGAGTPQAATTSYQYDPATLGRSTITDPNGHVTTNAYDNRGDLTSTTDAAGDTTRFYYDSFGDLTDRTDALGTTTTYQYDGNGNLLSKSTPLSGGGAATTSYTYGPGAAAGEVLSSTDPNGNQTSFGYDGAGDQTSVTDPLGNKTTATFDSDGRLISKTNQTATPRRTRTTLTPS